MSHLYGVGLDIETKRILMCFKMQIMKSGGGLGIRTLATIFKRLDQNGNRKLDKQEFTDALASFGFFPKIIEVQALMKFFDTDGDGNISYEEFLKGLRDPLNERRLKIVEKAFRQLDREGSGTITVSDIIGIYEVSSNKDFLSGKKSREQVLEEFLNCFEGAQKNGIVSQQEFIDYYSDLSMGIPDDRFFVQMMESAWQLCEDEESSVFKEQIEFLTKTVRQRLLAFANKNSDEYILRQIFKDFDTNKSGSLTIDELTNVLAKIQVSCERKYITALLKKFDNNQNGTIEFEEFCDFIIHNPYK